MFRGHHASFGSRGGVVLEFPKDWKQCLGALAKYFHFSTKELWNFDADEMRFWMDRLNEQGEAIQKKIGGKFGEGNARQG